MLLQDRAKGYLWSFVSSPHCAGNNFAEPQARYSPHTMLGTMETNVEGSPAHRRRNSHANTVTEAKLSLHVLSSCSADQATKRCCWTEDPSTESVIEITSLRSRRASFHIIFLVIKGKVTTSQNCTRRIVRNSGSQTSATMRGASSNEPTNWPNLYKNEDIWYCREKVLRYQIATLNFRSQTQAPPVLKTTQHSRAF